MKAGILLLFLLSCKLSGYAQYMSFDFEGYERAYLLHLPEGYTGSEPLPLVIAMHGGFGSAENLQEQSGLSYKSDEENFIVVYPEGIMGGLLGIRTWNAGWCCGYASNSDVDDVGFINALLDLLISRYEIDTNRIYATGMSNGGFMAYRLACELSSRIAAIAPVAASMSVTGYVPVRPVPIIHFHSYEDSSVPYSGGIGDGISDHYNAPLDSVLNAWAEINECRDIHEIVTDNGQFTHLQWINCDCSADIQLYLTHDGGHSWPGGTQTIIGDPVSQYISANDLMWAFFEQHTLNCDDVTSSVDLSEAEHDIVISPNPTTGQVTVKVSSRFRDYKILVFNQSGDEVMKDRNTKTLDLSSYPAGTYFITIRVDGLKITKKISLTPN